MGAVFLSNDKRHMVDLSMKELLDEYVAVTNMFTKSFDVYMYTPTESSKKPEYEREMTGWHEHRNKFAIEIADRLTK
jgi:hypothetical protein